MTSNRVITVNLEELTKAIDEKLANGSLQNYIIKEVSTFKEDPTNVFMADMFLQSPDNTVPGIGKSFGEFEENVRDGKIHKIIELYYAITMKKIDSGEVQRNIDETLKKLLESVNKMTDANPNTNKDINKDRRDNNDNNDDNPNKRRK